jgi:hypothetical protein
MHKLFLFLVLPSFTHAMNVGAPVPRVAMNEDSFFSEETYRERCSCCCATIGTVVGWARFLNKPASGNLQEFTSYLTGPILFPMACIYLGGKLGEDAHGIDRGLKALIRRWREKEKSE